MSLTLDKEIFHLSALYDRRVYFECVHMPFLNVQGNLLRHRALCDSTYLAGYRSDVLRAKIMHDGIGFCVLFAGYVGKFGR